MASIQIKGLQQVEIMLAKLVANADQATEKALRAGAGIIADRVRRNLEGLQEDYTPDPNAKYHYLKPGEAYSGIPRSQKEDLLNALGITPINVSESGVYDVKIGFESPVSGNEKGYGSQKTRKYPKGQPLAMIARSVESGTSIQPKQPFVRPAVNATRKKAVDKMQRVIEEETQKTTQK